MPPGCTKNPLCQLADGWDQSQGIWGSLNVELEQGLPITSTTGGLTYTNKIEKLLAVEVVSLLWYPIE